MLCPAHGSSSTQAWIAFETARRLVARGRRPPLKVYVSGARAPSLAGPAQARQLQQRPRFPLFDAPARSAAIRHKSLISSS